MPTKRTPIYRTPSTWIARFCAEGVVPRVQDDPAGWHELDRWCLGEGIAGLPPRHSGEGQALMAQAVSKGWVPLR